MWYSIAPLDLINPEYESDKLPLHIPIDASVTKETDCRICAEQYSLIFQAEKQKEVVKTEDLLSLETALVLFYNKMHSITIKSCGRGRTGICRKQKCKRGLPGQELDRGRTPQAGS